MRANSWNAPWPARKMTEQIRSLATELQTLQQELYRELAFPDGTPRRNPLGIEAYSKSDVRMLREAVDQFRRVLWFYLDQADTEQNLDERKPPASTKSFQKEHQVLAEQRSFAPPIPQQPSFFDRLDMVIEGYLQNGGQLLDPSKPNAVPAGPLRPAKPKPA